MAGIVLMLSLLAAGGLVAAPSSEAQAISGEITVTNTVIGPRTSSHEFRVVPEFPGCTAEQAITMGPLDDEVTVSVAATASGGAARNARLSFVTGGPGDLEPTPEFNDVTNIDIQVEFASDVQFLPGTVLENPTIELIVYTVSGLLPTTTPSGFPAFRLEREIVGADFYAQGSSITIRIADSADLSDGLQMSDLVDDGEPGLVFDAREVNTGRYHPPILELSSDGTGEIRNSNNTGGVNPATGEVVVVDYGDEYFTALGDGIPPTTIGEPATDMCTYTVVPLASDDFEPLNEPAAGIEPGGTTHFLNLFSGEITCRGQAATFDYRNDLAIAGPGRPGISVIGTDGDDVLVGSSGMDDIDGGAGNDVICGADDRDILFGGFGRDLIFGDGGDDLLRGFDGVDWLLGGAGNDTIVGDGGSDRMYGGPGADDMTGGSGADRMFGGDGDDEMSGGGGKDTMHGEGGNDNIQGNHQSDLITGGDGADTLRGAKGKDKIFGGAGNDMMFGGDNSDFLDGEAGVDEADGQRGRENPLEVGVKGCIAETTVNC